MAAAHSNPLSAWTLVRLFAGSARTAMTSGVSRSLTRPLGPSGRKIGSQYAESSFDSLASSCSSRLTDELFTQMKRAGWRFAGDGAHRAASRISSTSASGTMPGLNARTARRVRMSALMEPRTSTLISRLHDHFQRAVDAFVERPQGFGELGELEVVRDELRRGDATVGDQRDHLFHRVPIGSDPVEIDLLEDDLLKVDRRRLLGDTRERDPSTLTDHPDRLPDRVLGAGRVDGDVGPEAGSQVPDPGHRIAVVVIDGIEPELLRALEPLAAAHDDAASGAERAGAHRGEETHPAGAGGHEDVVRIHARPLHRVQRDRRRVAKRSDVQRHRVRDPKDALDRVDHVRRVRTLGVVAVLTMAEILPTVVEAQVVAAGPAHPAVAAARVARPGDASSRAEAVGGRDLARLDDFAGPLVTGYERVGAWPAAFEASLDDLGVGPADRDRAHARQHLVRCGARDRHIVADLERVRPREHERLHRRGLRRSARPNGLHGWNATTRQMQPSPFSQRQGNAPTSMRRPATSAISPPRFSSIGMFALAMW